MQSTATGILDVDWKVWLTRPALGWQGSSRDAEGQVLKAAKEVVEELKKNLAGAKAEMDKAEARFNLLRADLEASSRSSSSSLQSVFRC